MVPLAQVIFEQKPDIDPKTEAVKYIDPAKGTASIEEALAGSRDIIAEWVNEDAGARAQMRGLFLEKGIFEAKVIKGKEIEGVKFKDY